MSALGMAVRGCSLSRSDEIVVDDLRVQKAPRRPQFSNGQSDSRRSSGNTDLANGRPHPTHLCKRGGLAATDHETTSVFHTGEPEPTRDCQWLGRTPEANAPRRIDRDVGVTSALVPVRRQSREGTGVPQNAVKRRRTEHQQKCRQRRQPSNRHGCPLLCATLAQRTPMLLSGGRRTRPPTCPTRAAIIAGDIIHLCTGCASP